MAATEHKVVLLFGPPGSGKSTQGCALGQLPGLIHYDMGEALRRADEGTELGRKILSEISAGRLLSDELVLELFVDDLESLTQDGRYRPGEDVLLLDGVPRTRGQAEALSGRLDLVGVIELAVEDRTELVERLLRMGLENGRADDIDASIVDERLRQFDRASRPLLATFDPEIVRTVDAAKRPLEVLGDVVEALTALVNYKERR